MTNSSAPTAPGRTADGLVHRIETQDAAVSLSRFLMDPTRGIPVIVVTMRPNATEPTLGAAELARDLAGLASVAVLTPAATFGLTDGLGDRGLSVFYGAGRVYPVGLDWVRKRSLAPLHLLHDASRAASVTDAIGADALSAAHAAGLLGQRPQQPRDRQTIATVQGPTGRHVLLRLADGGQAAMLLAELRLDVPFDRLLTRRMKLAGRVRANGVLGQFYPDPVPDDPGARARATFPNGSIALVSVQEVAGETATMALHPDVPGILRGDPGDDLNILWSAGDVTAVSVTWDPEGTGPVFEIADLPADRAGTWSMPVLPGGPPWLLPSDLDVPAEPEPVVGSATADGAHEVGELLPDLAVATDMVRSLEEQVLELMEQVEAKERELQQTKRALRKAKTGGFRAPSVHTDPQQQLRFEIGLAHLVRFSEDERARRPLAEGYLFGPRFIESVTELQGISREKVVDVLVEVLVGLDKEIASRQLHPFRTSKGGPQQVRADGATAWRVSLQVKSPSARRLKYWRRTDGVIELDSVGVHDDGI